MSNVFAPGDRVRVREDFPPGHIRTPVYIRGKTGTVTRRFGTFENPELLAYRLEGPRKTLYEVRFRQAELWPDYAGAGDDTLDIDLYDHWLEKA
ncbi:MAG TPA: SH3-like domain-containing protein [Alphaproteobacteria bacterium]|jgi:nitrile hydratase